MQLTIGDVPEIEEILIELYDHLSLNPSEHLTHEFTQTSIPELLKGLFYVVSVMTAEAIDQGLFVLMPNLFTILSTAIKDGLIKPSLECLYALCNKRPDFFKIQKVDEIITFAITVTNLQDFHKILSSSTTSPAEINSSLYWLKHYFELRQRSTHDFVEKIIAPIFDLIIRNWTVDAKRYIYEKVFLKISASFSSLLGNDLIYSFHLDAINSSITVNDYDVDKLIKDVNQHILSDIESLTEFHKVYYSGTRDPINDTYTRLNIWKVISLYTTNPTPIIHQILKAYPKIALIDCIPDDPSIKHFNKTLERICAVLLSYLTVLEKKNERLGCVLEEFHDEIFHLLVSSDEKLRHVSNMIVQKGVESMVLINGYLKNNSML